MFERRREETEDTPDDWRCWFRLAVAYQDARDTPRARKAMQRAIALHRSPIPTPSGDHSTLPGDHSGPSGDASTPSGGHSTPSGDQSSPSGV